MPPAWADHHLVGVGVCRCGDNRGNHTGDGLRREEIGRVVFTALVGNETLLHLGVDSTGVDAGDPE